MGTPGAPGWGGGCQGKKNRHRSIFALVIRWKSDIHGTSASYLTGIKYQGGAMIKRSIKRQGYLPFNETRDGWFQSYPEYFRLTLGKAKRRKTRKAK